MAPVVTFVGLSGTGKTTYLERLIPVLKDRGLRVAVVKHDAHRVELDRPGKDTWRFSQAGADVVAISSRSLFAVLEQPQEELPLEAVLARLPEADLVLVEGYKHNPSPKIELHRAALGNPLLSDPAQLLAVATDEPLDVPVPQLPLDDPKPCAALLLAWLKTQK